MLRSDVTKLKKPFWLAVIIDEAQNIKNAGMAQSKAVGAFPQKCTTFTANAQSAQE